MRRRLEELEQYAIEVILDKKHGFRATLLRTALRLLSNDRIGDVKGLDPATEQHSRQPLSTKRGTRGFHMTLLCAVR